MRTKISFTTTVIHYLKKNIYNILSIIVEIRIIFKFSSSSISILPEINKFIKFIICLTMIQNIFLISFNDL